MDVAKTSGANLSTGRQPKGSPMYHARHADDPHRPACDARAPHNKILMLAENTAAVSCPDCWRVLSVRPAHYAPTRRSHRYPRN